MKDENKIISKVLLKTVKRLEKFYGNDKKLEELNEMSLEFLLNELKKESFELEVISNVPKSVAKKTKISKGIIAKEKVDYGWQDSRPKRKMVILPFENQDNFSIGMGASTLSLALTQDGVINDANKAGTFEVLVHNKDLAVDIKLKDDFQVNISDLRRVMLEDSKVSVLDNNLNTELRNKTLGLDMKTFIETGNGVQPTIRVAMKEAHFFRGFVTHDVAQWIAIFCIAAGIKCQIRQSYLEDAIHRDLNWIQDPNVERALSMHKTVSPNINKIWEEKDWCRSSKAIAFVNPFSSWVDSVLNKTTSYENEIVAFNQQIFYLRRK